MRFRNQEIAAIHTSTNDFSVRNRRAKGIKSQKGRHCCALVKTMNELGQLYQILNYN